MGFTDRPIAMEQMLPATWSNAGFGLYGKNIAVTGCSVTDVSVVLTEALSITNRIRPARLKENTDRFEETASGEPLFTGKIAARNNKIGELGLSYMGGAYNNFKDDGNIVDYKRRVDVFAVDFNTTLPRSVYPTALVATLR